MQVRLLLHHISCILEKADKAIHEHLSFYLMIKLQFLLMNHRCHLLHGKLQGRVGRLQRNNRSRLADIHLVGRGSLTAQYILVLDALNFCFWPQENLQYGNLARGLKVSLLHSII